MNFSISVTLLIFSETCLKIHSACLISSGLLKDLEMSLTALNNSLVFDFKSLKQSSFV